MTETIRSKVYILDVYSTIVFDRAYIDRQRIDDTDCITIMSLDESVCLWFPVASVRVTTDTPEKYCIELCPPRGTIVEVGHPLDFAAEESN